MHLPFLMKAWLGALFFLTRLLISIRYRVTIRGDFLKKGSSLKEGILFLPNHPAEIDPVILLLVLWPRFRPHPIVVETFYYLKGAHYLQKIVGALPMPELGGTVNKWKQKQVEKLFAHVSQELQKGENFLIYPSGRLKQTGEEILGGASFVHNLLQACPKTQIVLIRTTGLWGSRFSRALTGRTPNLGKAFLEGAKVVLKNGIFLTPRRNVVIEIEMAPADLPISASRLEFNRYLERWYNVNGPEPMKLVSDCFWKNRFPKVASDVKKIEGQKTEIGEALQTEVLTKLGEMTRRDPSKIESTMQLSKDLGLDSLDLAQLAVFLEEKYQIEGLVVGSLITVEDVLRVASGSEKESLPKEENPQIASYWPKELVRPGVQPPQGKTIQESFLRICDRMDGHVACADAVYGMMSYRKMKLTVLLLAEQFKKLEEKQVGVLLPSSIGAYLTILGLLLAKKVPVMLNWTVGYRPLAHCAQVAELKHVISSRRFLNNLSNGDLEPIDAMILLLEDLKDEIHLGQKIKGVYRLLKDADTLVDQFNLKEVDSTDPAVILFTSGTETLPKGVPLSHHNLQANQTAGLSCIDLKSSDILYGVLPPFHSFGFSVTGLMPLLSGVRVYYAPDPTNTKGMIGDIRAWKPTVFCSAPTFTRALFRTAKPQDLQSIRYFVSGAEKTPQELFDYVQQLGPGHELLEGYGITECGPVVSLCRPQKPRIGVGLPLPGVELTIADLETKEKLPPGKEGEICIYGPNVFSGYLGIDKDPFVTLDGKKWYRSGDRGSVDSEGHLILSGRLKRFVKVGGEMISLGGLEEELLKFAQEKQWVKEPPTEGPPLAVGASEKEGQRPSIVLFTTFDLDKDEANKALRDSGYGRIVKIGEVRKIPQIPITGTGKIHYRALDELC